MELISVGVVYLRLPSRKAFDPLPLTSYLLSPGSAEARPSCALPFPLFIFSPSFAPADRNPFPPLVSSVWYVTTN